MNKKNILVNLGCRLNIYEGEIIKNHLKDNNLNMSINKLNKLIQYKIYYDKISHGTNICNLYTFMDCRPIIGPYEF